MNLEDNDMSIDKFELESFYKEHSNTETAEHFNLSKSTLQRLLTKYNIPKKVAFATHTSVDAFINEFLVSNNADEFKQDFYNHTQKELCNKYNITVRQIKYLKKYLNLNNRIHAVDDIKINDIDTFYDYYLSHSDVETIKQYDLNNSFTLKKILSNNNLEIKSSYKTVDDILQRINVSEFIDYYQTHTIKEVSEHFNIKCVRNVLIKLNLPTSKQKSRESFDSVLQRVDKKRFIELYQSGRYEDIYNELNLAYTTVRKLKDYWNVDNKTKTIDDLLLGLDVTSFINDVDNNIIDIQMIKSKYNIESDWYVYRLINHLNIKPKRIGSLIEESIKTYISTISDTTIIPWARNIPGMEGKEIDIYLPEYRIGIEVNGTYWHSNIVQSDKKYHFNKSLLAEQSNIHLIHIWEYEWNDPSQQEIIKTFLRLMLHKVEKRIYARQCEIKAISNKEAMTFNETNHLQGHRNAQVTYGLFYNDKLVQLMSFSKTKYNRNLSDANSWEIIRGCPGSNNLVVGGVSKLFTHFVRDYSPTKVFSYCDFNKFDGKSYSELGMRFIGYTGPDVKYLMPDRSVINRSPKKYKENMSNAIALLYGAGSKKFEWSIE